MRPTFSWIVLASTAAAVLLAGCGRDAALDALAAGQGGRVAAVLSGDTLALEGGRTVRLAGVDAPRATEPYATESRAALEGLALGREIQLLHGGARGDGAGRDVGHARVGRRWLQQALLEAGAVRVRVAEDRALAREMLEAEAKARVAGRGIWALPVYRVALPREIGPDARGYHVVEGRVLRAAANGPRLYLEFSPDWRGGFSAETPLSALGEFAAAGIELRALEGRLVRVRGEVRPTRYGPRLSLDHPEQLERLTQAGPDPR